MGPRREVGTAVASPAPTDNRWFGRRHGHGGRVQRTWQRAGFGPLPGTIKEDIAALELRTTQLLNRLSDTEERLEDRSAELRAELQGVRDQLTAADKKIEKLAVRAAVGGISASGRGPLPSDSRAKGRPRA